MKAQHALGDTAVQQLLMDPGIDREGLVLYIDPQAGAAPPAWLSPMISAEFMKIPRLGMIFGDEPGYVWIRGDALHAIRAVINLEGVRVRNCSDLIRNLNILDYDVKRLGDQHPTTGEDLRDEQMFAEFTRTSLIPLLAGLVSFAVCALFSGMFVNWVTGVENWLIGGSWGALLGSFVTRKYLARGRQ